MSYEAFWYVFFAVLIAIVMLRAAIIARLRNKFPSIWKSLGEPAYLETGIWNGPSRRADFYILAGKWIDTRDLTLTTMCATTIALFVVDVTLFCYVIATF